MRAHLYTFSLGLLRRCQEEIGREGGTQEHGKWREGREQERKSWQMGRSTCLGVWGDHPHLLISVHLFQTPHAHRI